MQKKTGKPLILNKETLRRLELGELSKVEGAASIMNVGCTEGSWNSATCCVLY